MILPAFEQNPPRVPSSLGAISHPPLESTHFRRATSTDTDRLVFHNFPVESSPLQAQPSEAKMLNPQPQIVETENPRPETFYIHSRPTNPKQQILNPRRQHPKHQVLEVAFQTRVEFPRMLSWQPNGQGFRVRGWVQGVGQKVMGRRVYRLQSVLTQKCGE